MTVAAAHFVGSVADPGINDSLVNPCGGAVAAKGMTKYVPASKMLEAAVFERVVEVIVHFTS